MTILIFDVATLDGSRRFELLASFQREVVLAETCHETYPGGRRELRETRDVLLMLGRKPGALA